MLNKKVIVYGVDTQIGLSLVRELGEKGYQVVAIGKSSNSLGLTSKYASYRYVLEGTDDKGKVAFLTRVARETSAVYLLCVSEDDILFFNRVREQLAPLQPLVPEQSLIDKVLSKEYTAKVAQEVGIDTPQSWQINHIDELSEIGQQARYPVVLKWSNPHAVVTQARAAGLKLEKLIYCYTEAELQHWAQYYAPINAWPMIQEYCPGNGLGQFFFMHKGEALLSFQHARLHEWPPEGGFSTLCKSIPLSEHEPLQKKSVALLKALGWEGAAMVEYRYDDTSKRAVLMEINGRFWGSLPLAYHSNVPFADYTVRVLGEGDVPDSAPEIIERLQCRNTLVELKRLFRIVFQASKIPDKSLRFNRFNEIVKFVGGYFNPAMRYYVFSLKDPRPWLQDTCNLARKLAGKLMSLPKEKGTQRIL